MDFAESEKKAYEKDPEKYEKGRKEDARQAYKNFDRYENEKLMERAERMAKSKEARSGGGGGGGAGGMPKLNRDLTKNMKKGGKVSSASSRGDGIAQRGKTRGALR